MKKETQFLCIVLLCSVALSMSGCGIRPSKLISPTEVEQDRAKEAGETPQANAKPIPVFPAIYPKPAR